MSERNIAGEVGFHKEFPYALEKQLFHDTIKNS